MNHHERAVALKNLANQASIDGDDARCGDLMLQAAELYRLAGDVREEKYCVAYGYYSKANALKVGNPGHRRKGDYLERAIAAQNELLAIDPDAHSSRVNLRHLESSRFRFLAITEYRGAYEDPRSDTVHRLRKAAEYRLSCSQSMYAAYQLEKDMGYILSAYARLAWYYQDRYWTNVYRASAEEANGDYALAHDFYQVAREDAQRSLEYHEKALSGKDYDYSESKVISSARETIKDSRGYLRDIERMIEECRERMGAEAPVRTGRPELSVDIRASEGLVKNLFSPIEVKLVNNGSGDALDISISIDGFVDGETEARLAHLPPGRSNLLALAMKPVEAGTCRLKVLVDFEDAQGSEHSVEKDVWVKVSPPEGTRERGQTIIYIEKAEFKGQVDVERSVVDAVRVDALVGPRNIASTGSGARRPHYIVEQVLVIYRDGRLIVPCTREGCESEDVDLMSGMLVAVQGIIKDGLRSGGVLRSIIYGDNMILLANGEHVVLAAVIYGHHDDKLVTDIEELVATIERNFSDELKCWSGDPEDLGGIREVVMSLIHRTARVSREDVMAASVPAPAGKGPASLLSSKREIIFNLGNRIQETIYCSKCGRCIERMDSFRCPDCERVLCTDHRQDPDGPCDECANILRQQAEVKDSFYEADHIDHDPVPVGERGRGKGRLGLLEVRLPGKDKQVVYLSEENMRAYARIGRDPNNDIIVKHRTVSRHHAQLMRGEDGLYIVDSCSTEGVRVNDEPVKVARLRDGAILSLGERMLFYSEEYRSLVYLDGIHEGSIVLLDKIMIAKDFNIGRCPTNEIVIDAPLVSRHHARILVRRNDLFLEDLGSKDGTFLNELCIKGLSKLEDGDVIGVGHVRLTFRR